MSKRVFVLTLCVILLVTPLSAFAQEDISLTAKSAILVEKSSGNVLFEKNADEALPPASVTKIMTLLLVFEAIEAGRLTYEDMVPVSAYAAGMGGSQAYMEEGEEMSVDDMLKAVFVSSCNDAAVALGEKISGSIDVFVSLMNERASQLGMSNTYFENCTGLDDTNRTSARDIAIMARELIKYPKVREYATIWMDTIRDGQFGLSNTNKLVKTYNGITGLKTGFTSEAMYCLCATAERDGMELIAVVLGCPTSNDRFNDATALLNYGFANYGVVSYELPHIADLKVQRGKNSLVKVAPDVPSVTALIKKGDNVGITAKTDMKKSIKAPVAKGTKVGRVSYYLGENLLCESDVVTVEDAREKSLVDWICYIWLVVMR